MRFGLPADIQLVEPTDDIANLTKTLENTRLRSRFELITEELRRYDHTQVISSKSHPNPPNEANLMGKLLEAQQDSGSHVTDSRSNHVLQSTNNNNNNLRVLTELYVSDTLANEYQLLRSIEGGMAVRQREVEVIVRREIERKRRIEEERRLVEEAERKRREEEKKRQKEAEERRKREEEERRKKLEEERKRQEELEKKRLAEEAEKKRVEALKLQKQKEEAAKAAEKAEKERKELEKKQNDLKKTKGMTNFAEIERQFLKYKKDIVDIKSQVVEPLKTSPIKAPCSKLKRQINPKFGQLTNSKSQLLRIIHEVIALVHDAKRADELAFKWILNFIAKAVVAQAETEVTVSTHAALPLAGLAASLVMEFPELEYYLTARFVKKCPFVIGYTCSVETEQGRLRMGWKRSKDKWEEDTKYNERMGGIFTVYSVLTRIQLKDFSDIAAHTQLAYPYPISLSWTALARLLNTPPELLSNAHYACVANWWDANAKQFKTAFGKQADKMLRLVCRDWTLLVAERRFSNAARLRILGDDWIENGRISEIKGMER